MKCKMIESVNQHQHHNSKTQEQCSLCLWQRRIFSNGVDCYNVQHHGGIGQKPVEGTICDDR